MKDFHWLKTFCFSSSSPLLIFFPISFIPAILPSLLAFFPIISCFSFCCSLSYPSLLLIFHASPPPVLSSFFLFCPLFLHPLLLHLSSLHLSWWMALGGPGGFDSSAVSQWPIGASQKCLRKTGHKKLCVCVCVCVCVGRCVKLKVMRALQRVFFLLGSFSPADWEWGWYNMSVC